MHFTKLDDSPMFRQQVHCLEESADGLREKCLKLYKGCRKYTEGLGESYDEDIGFVSSLETFGGAHNDPVSSGFGEPVMNKFTIALREIAVYKEILRLKVEHMLNDMLHNFVIVDLNDVKEARKRFDKATLIYDQAREKFLSLRKSAKLDIANVLEEELRIARSKFEQARFNLVRSLSNTEAKKRFEFLEAFGGTMSAHLDYFKQGYELLHQMEPFINQVLTYAKQSRESFDREQESLNEQMEEYQMQIDRDSRKCSGGFDGSPKAERMQTFARSSHKEIEAVMQSASNGKVQTIRQGYLSKRSSNLRGDWKRRFFVLDSRGMLYYYRKQWSRLSGAGSAQKNIGSEHGSGLLNRWRSSHYHCGANDEKSVACHTVNLLTSTIKIDADQSDLRFCFRIISPSKIYALQAESAVDQMDWIEKINGVIASLLTSQSPEHVSDSCLGQCDNDSARESSSPGSDFDCDSTGSEEHTSRNPASRNPLRLSRSHQQLQPVVKSEKPIDILRKVIGNDKCADCGSPEPDWASLNLGVLICIECSGVHRNLGVHISKVRSLTLDVKAWEPSVINLFQSLGNVYANSIWEELLNLKSSFQHEEPMKVDKQKLLHMCKPCPDDPISTKEKFINAKYVEKLFVRRIKDNQQHTLATQRVWESVRINDKKGVYRYIVNSEVSVNYIHGKTSLGGSLDKASSLPLNSPRKIEDPLVEEHFDGCYPLHLACQIADIGMVELLLQYGANVNASDSKGQTPLHHCIIRGRSPIMKLLLSRGANPLAVDSEGKTALQLATECSFNDNEALTLLRNANR